MMAVQSESEPASEEPEHQPERAGGDRRKPVPLRVRTCVGAAPLRIEPGAGRGDLRQVQGPSLRRRRHPHLAPRPRLRGHARRERGRVPPVPLLRPDVALLHRPPRLPRRAHRQGRPQQRRNKRRAREQIEAALEQPSSTRWVATLLGLFGMAWAGRSLDEGARRRELPGMAAPRQDEGVPQGDGCHCGTDRRHRAGRDARRATPRQRHHGRGDVVPRGLRLLHRRVARADHPSPAPRRRPTRVPSCRAQ